MTRSAKRSATAVDGDVAVVGAGLAGLVAARDLAGAGLAVRVFEARERVGGRVANHALADGKVIEIGGEFAGVGQHSLYALAASLGVATFPAYDEGDRLVEMGGRVRRYRGSVPRLGPLVLADLGQALWRLQRMARSLPEGAPWRARDAERWDRQSLGAWIRRNVRTRRARALIETGAETIWPLPPEELSLLHALFYLRFAGGLATLAETAGGAQEDRFVGGSFELAARLAARLEGRIELDAPVSAVHWSADGVRVTAAGDEYSARRALLAMSPTLWGRIRFDPPLPVDYDQLAQRMPQGAVIKCQALYDGPFWRNAGLRGQAVSERGPTSVTIDNSPPDGSPGVLLGFIVGRAARQASRLPPDERRRAVIDGFVRLFGPAAARPCDYVEQNWSAEPYSRGCYAAAFGPNGWTELGPRLGAPIGPLHWAGAETASRWYGYMEGAVSSGHRAAREIVRDLGATGTEPAHGAASARPAYHDATATW
jgi:monoamine oxidase